MKLEVNLVHSTIETNSNHNIYKNSRKLERIDNQEIGIKMSNNKNYKRWWINQWIVKISKNSIDSTVNFN